jgi:hypothetical protein
MRVLMQCGTLLWPLDNLQFVAVVGSLLEACPVGSAP